MQYLSDTALEREEVNVGCLEDAGLREVTRLRMTILLSRENTQQIITAIAWRASSFVWHDSMLIVCVAIS